MTSSVAADIVHWLRRNASQIDSQLKAQSPQRSDRPAKGTLGKGIVEGAVHLVLHVDMAMELEQNMSFANRMLQEFQQSLAEMRKAIGRLLIGRRTFGKHDWACDRPIHLTLRLDNFWTPVSLTARSIGRGLVGIRALVLKTMRPENLLWSTSEHALVNPVEMSVQMLELVQLNTSGLQRGPTAWAWRLCAVITGELVGAFESGDEVLALGMLQSGPPTGAKIATPCFSRRSHFWFVVNNIVPSMIARKSAIANTVTKAVAAVGAAGPVVAVTQKPHSLWDATRNLVDGFGHGVAPLGRCTLTSLAVLTSVLSTSPRATAGGRAGGCDSIHILVESDCNFMRRLLVMGSRLCCKAVWYPGAPVRDSDWLCIQGGVSLVWQSGNLSERAIHVLRDKLKRRKSAVWLVICNSAESAKRSVAKRLEDHFDIVIRDTELQPGAAGRAAADIQDARFILDGPATSPSLPHSTSPFPTLPQSVVAHRQSLDARTSKLSQTVLREYFLATRARCNCSFNALQSMIRVARAHTRLHGRSVVTPADALVAVLLREERRAHCAPRGTASLALGFRALPGGQLNVSQRYNGQRPQDRFRRFAQHVYRFSTM